MPERPASAPRLAVMTFAYEGDRRLAFEMLDSLVRSFDGEPFDLFVTDDASPSYVGEQIRAWGRARNIAVTVVRHDEKRGFRGAIERTVRLLREIAEQKHRYDLVLRIDTDALVIRPGLARALLAMAKDRRALYGVQRPMRGRDRIGLLLDLLPFGLRRCMNGREILRQTKLSRLRPVWWWRIGLSALLRGFRFRYVEGSCYAFGGEVPRALADAGLLQRHRADGHGLLSSEEDVMSMMMCRSLGLPFVATDAIDPTWKHVNTIGAGVLELAPEAAPYVIHALKDTPADDDLRQRIKAHMPLFADSAPTPG